MKADLTRIIEALLFTAEGPLKDEQILEVLPEASTESIAESISELKAFYEENNRSFMLINIAGGHQLLTRPDVSTWVEKFLIGRRRKRLSRAALEVLAVVAYQQPITRGEVEQVRGVDCGGVFRTLLERELVDVRGRAKTAGNPLLYVTSDKFLEHFGISSLKDMPKLDEFKALVDRDQAKSELQSAGMIPPDLPPAPSEDPLPEMVEKIETEINTEENDPLTASTAEEVITSETEPASGESEAGETDSVPAEPEADEIVFEIESVSGDEDISTDNTEVKGLDGSNPEIQPFNDYQAENRIETDEVIV